MSVKDSAYSFFKNENSKILFWFTIWVIEFFGFRWLFNKYEIPPSIISTIGLAGAAIGILFLIYWILTKRSTEMYIYAILICEFFAFNLDNPEIFESTLHFPLSYFIYGLVGYSIIRITVFPKIYSFISEIGSGLKEAQYEKAAERKNQRDALQIERTERLKRRKEKNRANRQHRIDKWKYIGSTIHSIFSGIRWNFAAIFEGLGDSKKAENSNKNYQTHADSEGKIVHLSILYLMIPVLICVTLFIISVIIARSEALKAVFSNTSGTGLTVQRIIEVVMSVTVLIIIGLILSAVLYNIIIQILIFVFHVRSDLQKASRSENHSITNNVLYALTFGIILYWIKKYYPFSVEEFATDLSSGQLVIYPLAFVFIAIIISFFTNNITTEDIKKYLTNQNAKQIWNDIYNLVANSINAVIKYLKLVTGDFLLSVQELTEEDGLIDDLEDDEDNG